MDRKVVTAADLEKMTPAERSEAFEAGIAWDLEDAPEALVTRARAWLEARIATEHDQLAE